MTSGKKILLIVLLLITIAGLYMLMVPHYVNMALVHGNPGISDYKIFDNRPVTAGQYQPWKISADYNRSSPSPEVMKKIESYRPIAFLVIQNKEIIFEKYWEGYSDSSLSGIFSAAKGIVGLLTGCAIADGYIRGIDQPVGDFIPHFREKPFDRITIRHLLTMSSGLDFDEAYSNLFSTTTELYYGNDAAGFVDKTGFKESPGKIYNYRSVDTQILGMVLTKATGKTLSEYASEKIWKPVGARTNALWSLDRKDGYEKAYCCFNTNARDLARVGQLVLDSGKWNGKQLVPWDYLKASISPSDLIDETGKKINYYGYQWWILHDETGDIPYTRGIGGQYLFVIPSLNAVVVRMGHQRSPVYNGHATVDIYYYVRAAREIVEQLK